MAAGLATLRELDREGIFEELEAAGRFLCDGLRERAEAASLPFSTSCVGGMFGLFFRSEVPRDFSEASTADTRRFSKFHRRMLEAGIYLAPSAFEAGFVSLAHRKRHLQQTLDAAETAFQGLRRLR